MTTTAEQYNQEGIEQDAYMIARQLLQETFDYIKVSDATGLILEDVQALALEILEAEEEHY